MASRIFRPSRVIAVLLVVGAAAWIASGQLGPHAEETTPPPTAPGKAPDAAMPVQKVSVTTAAPVKHQRTVLISCVTQADHRSIAVARAAGLVIGLNVSRGTAVKAGDVVAVISDEGRESVVIQAQALLDQRQAEFDSNKKLIDKGDAPKNSLPALEAAVAAAQAGLAAANAEAQKQNITAPVDGIVDDVPVQVGQAVQVGTEIAEVVGPDPMLAVGAISERQRNYLQMGQNVTTRFINGETVKGTISFVSLSAEKATRTYRVEARMANPDAAIPDGVTCEMSIALAAVDAAPVPKSALVFSDAGQIGVRVADSNSQAKFIPITVIDDDRDLVWVTGIGQTERVIVVGQDFVKDGDPVEAVSAAGADTKAAPPA